MTPRRNPESGFALLLVFLMAAIVAIMLYMEMPRVAFEAQRAREELLIEHGHEYERAIQLYFRRFQRYPPTLDALENTNNIRFLRRRFKDPMTGKDDWRIIHAGPGGVLTDSLTQKPPTKKDDSGFPTADLNPDTSGLAGASGPTGPAAARRRPSEVGGLRMPGGGTVSGGVAGGAENPETEPPPTEPGLPTGPAGPTGPTGDLPPSYPGSINPAEPNPNQGGPTNVPVPDMIRNLLTRPRNQPGIGGNVIGAGIAGVASKFEAEGIRVYHDQTKYNKWEFVYDPRKDMPGLATAQPVAPGQPPPAPINPMQPNPPPQSQAPPQP